MNTSDQASEAVFGPQRHMLELLYEVFARTGRWPLFQYVAQVWDDSEHRARDVYFDLSKRGLVRPSVARTAQFQLRDDTTVGVSLQGLMHLREASEDLGRFVSAVRYVAERAGRFRPPSATELARLEVTSEEVRQHLQLDPHDPGLRRIGELLSDEAWQLWTGFSGLNADQWSLHVNLERARRYKDIYTVIDFLDISDPDEHRDESWASSPATLLSTQPVPATDNKKVMVVHGRDKARDDLFSLLRALGLEPIEWSAAVKATGTTKPYTGQAVEAAFAAAQAAVILLVPEEQVALRNDLRDPKDPSDAQMAWQPRPNVFYEGGIAVTSHPDRTIVLELGRPRTATDLAGVNTVRIDSDQRWRHNLANRLRDAGCPANTDGTDWLTVGEFVEIKVEFLLPLLPAGGDPQPQRTGEIRNEGATKTRVELLQEQYRNGRSLQKRLVRTGGILETTEQAREVEDEARYQACKWGQGAWLVIAEHFSGYERQFFGDGHLALGATGFALACQNEIERLGSSADTYLERKLEIIAELLRKYDRETS
jgi:hypothetical protein